MYMKFFKCQVNAIYCVTVCTNIMFEINVLLQSVTGIKGATHLLAMGHFTLI